MDKQRAAEIAASPVMADVTHNGQSVYIETVNGNNGIASIHPLNEPKNRKDVSVDNLVEH